MVVNEWTVRLLYLFINIYYSTAACLLVNARSPRNVFKTVLRRLKNFKVLCSFFFLFFFIQFGIIEQYVKQSSNLWSSN